MGAEMDSCDATDDGKRFYVELKTSREVNFFFFFMKYFLDFFNLSTFSSKSFYFELANNAVGLPN